jgi:transcription initiation factor TFIIH subunit 2
MTSSAPSSGAGGGDNATDLANHAWEESTNVWENAVQEDSEGGIIIAGGDTTADIIRKRRKRLEQNDYAQRNRRVVRDMIRYVYVLIDCSRWVRQKDPLLTPGTKLEVTIQLLQEFIQEYYDQNPLSHLGFITLKGGEAEILTNLSSSSKTHKLALRDLSKMSGGPSGGG